MVAERRRNSTIRPLQFTILDAYRTRYYSVDPIIVVDPILGKIEEKLSLFRILIRVEVDSFQVQPPLNSTINHSRYLRFNLTVR